MEIDRPGFTVEEAIFCTSPDVRTIGPIKHKEYKEMGTAVEARMDKLETRVGMVEQSVASIDTILVGRDGKGGAIERLENGQAQTMALLKSIQESFQGLTNLHVSDVNEIKRSLDDNSHEIKEVRIVAERAEKKSDEHISEEEKEQETTRKKWGARSWDLFKTMAFLVIGALAAKYLGG